MQENRELQNPPKKSIHVNAKYNSNWFQPNHHLSSNSLPVLNTNPLLLYISNFTENSNFKAQLKQPKDQGTKIKTKTEKKAEKLS
jgi:hypothetical protein